MKSWIKREEMKGGGDKGEGTLWGPCIIEAGATVI